MDRDGDSVMLTAAHHSQFTQTLMLFSQTGSGQRYTPGWTRFYSSLPPEKLQAQVVKVLEKAGMKHKVLAPRAVPRGSECSLDAGGGEGDGGEVGRYGGGARGTRCVYALPLPY